MAARKITWPGPYIGAGMATWELMSVLMAVVHKAGGLPAAKVFLGVVEGFVFPGALYILSLFHTRKQFILRAAILYASLHLGKAFGGLFPIAILNSDGHNDLEGWRLRFLFNSAVLTLISVVLAFILPNSDTISRARNPRTRFA